MVPLDLYSCVMVLVRVGRERGGDVTGEKERKKRGGMRRKKKRGVRGRNIGKERERGGRGVIRGEKWQENIYVHIYIYKYIYEDYMLQSMRAQIKRSWSQMIDA